MWVNNSKWLKLLKFNVKGRHNLSEIINFFVIRVNLPKFTELILFQADFGGWTIAILIEWKFTEVNLFQTNLYIYKLPTLHMSITCPRYMSHRLLTT